jgi:RNA polymerase-binding protein DksA
MNKPQKIKLKKTLLNIREEIISKVKHIEKESLNKSQRDASGDLSGYTFHMADVASDNFEREMSLGLAANERELLKQIDDALSRLKEKNFGKCQRCEKDISFKRLSAVPYAQLCIACKEQEEKKRR